MEKKTENQVQKKIRPKQYTHIDYEALLIEAMKERCSIEECIERNGLNIARSTVSRNISKMRNAKKNFTVIDLYEKQYVPNMQKKKLPKKMQEKIDELPSKPVVIKPELEDLLRKLNIMNAILEQANGNYAEATRIINSGTTLLGKVKISFVGLKKDIEQLHRIRKMLEEKQEEKGERI